MIYIFLSFLMNIVVYLMNGEDGNRMWGRYAFPETLWGSIFINLEIKRGGGGGGYRRRSRFDFIYIIL